MQAELRQCQLMWIDGVLRSISRETYDDLPIHEYQKAQLECKLPQQACKKVDAEYRWVGPCWAQLWQGLGVADEEEHAGSQHA